jgi:hypothetical protein
MVAGNLERTRKAKKPGNRSDREVGAERSGERNRESTNRKHTLHQIQKTCVVDMRRR